jgi:hypothetical protein
MQFVQVEELYGQNAQIQAKVKKYLPFFTKTLDNLHP